MTDQRPFFFPRPALKGQARLKHLQTCLTDHSDLLGDMRTTKRVMQRITMPADGTWAYGSNPKAATTTTYNALFELTFGHRLSAALDEGVANWVDQPAQNLGQGQLFYQLAEFENSLAAMDLAFRFSVVRNPYDRAVSAFHFVCFSQDKAMRHFYTDRLRMNVLGFDWDTDPYTEQGFEKFMNYVEFEAHDTRTSGRLPDPHFRPQAMNICLEFLNPHLVFRVDDLAEGLQVIATQLGRPQFSEKTTKARLNAQPERQSYTKHNALIERVYAPDFEIYESASCALRQSWTIPSHS